MAYIYSECGIDVAKSTMKPLLDKNTELFRATTMKVIKSFSLLLLLLTLNSPASAAMINFSSGAAASVITNTYNDMGVNFSLSATKGNHYTSAVIDSFGSQQTKGLFNTFNYNSSIIAAFTGTVHTVSFTSIIGSPLTMTALNIFGGSIGKVSISGGSEMGRFSSDSAIAKLVFLNDSGTGYKGRSDLTTISSLSFTTTEVPLPASLWLFISGLAGLAWKQARRH
jgi:hypothetical protein